MKIHTHTLRGHAPGTRRTVTSLHFGTPDSGRKAYLQASLHADEIPPMLVAQHLRGALAGLEQAGRLRGEVVLVPSANPLGLDQHVLEAPVGRFDLASGENFNRRYADLHAIVAPLLDDLRGTPQQNVASVRALLRDACATLPDLTELQCLRKTLLGLAIDADTVLDLHSDNEATLHLYTTPALWPHVEPLARELASPLTLLADGSGEEPFDEACSMVWQRLAKHLSVAKPRVQTGEAFAQACVAATIELRGERDVHHATAAADARAVLRYLAHRGHLELQEDRPMTPPTRTLVHPLAGSMPVPAPASGVLVYLRELGSTLVEGEPFAEIIDPVSGHVTTVRSPVDGFFFARDARRFVRSGARIAKISGALAVRRGNLMSA